MKPRNSIEKKLTDKSKIRPMRKQEKQNELNRYCRLMDFCIEVGFFREEALQYTRSLLRR